MTDMGPNCCSQLIRARSENADARAITWILTESMATASLVMLGRLAIAAEMPQADLAALEEWRRSEEPADRRG
jgi:hypothetical protein